MEPAMKHPRHTFYPPIEKLAEKPSLAERVLRKLYVVAVFVVVILLWTGL
jgi:hypothetical protein